MTRESDQGWIRIEAERIAAVAPGHTVRLLEVPSRSGDRAGAELAVAAFREMLPDRSVVSRPASSTPGYARDVLATLDGTGSGRLLLLGHIDTVLDDVGRTRIDGGLILGPGSYDMKGGLAIAAGVLESLAGRPQLYERVDLLCVADEEWRWQPLSHGAAGRWDACLCFEGGEPEGPALICRRKGATLLRIVARGRAAHAGVGPAEGRSALLALARVAHDLSTDDPRGLTAAPTVLHAGDAINAVPSRGELSIDVRSFSSDALAGFASDLPASIGDVVLDVERIERFPPMDTRGSTAALLEDVSDLLGMPVRAAERGGSSDAAFVARHVPVSVDGLGPTGGSDHSPEEYCEIASFAPQARLALASALAALRSGRG